MHDKTTVSVPRFSFLVNITLKAYCVHTRSYLGIFKPGRMFAILKIPAATRSSDKKVIQVQIEDDLQ